MSFSFDPRAALARIRNEASAPATPAIVATVEGQAAETVAGIATVAGRDAEFERSAADPDAFAERAAIAEFDGGLSHDAAERLAANAQGFAAPADLHAAAVARWAFELERTAAGNNGAAGRRCIAAALRFIRDGWAEKALALGWTKLELVGADPRAPWERLDRLGAAYSRFAPIAVTRDAITYSPALRRYRAAQADGAELAWVKTT